MDDVANIPLAVAGPEYLRLERGFRVVNRKGLPIAKIWDSEACEQYTEGSRTDARETWALWIGGCTFQLASLRPMFFVLWWSVALVSTATAEPAQSL